MTTVSIIIPAHNAARFLPQTIDSVRMQTFAAWELIVVNDGSTDGTAVLVEAAAARDGRIRLLSQVNAGASAARNAGLACSSPNAPFVAFLDADDLWEADALETLLAALETHPDCAAAYGLARTIDADGRFDEADALEAHQIERWGIDDGRLTRWPAGRPTTFAVEAVTERVITSGTVLLRRAALAQLVEAKGGPLFDPALRLWEDWDVWLRLTAHVGDMGFVEKPVLRYRRHGSNLSTDQRALDSSAEQVRRKLFAFLGTDPQQRQIARLGRRFHHLLIARRRMEWARDALRQGQTGTALKQWRHAATSFGRARR